MITREDAKATLPDGWADLVDAMFNLVEASGVEVRYIKNKMGFLRLHSSKPLQDKAYILQAQLEAESEKTCMHCGAYGKRRNREFSHIILCEECNDIGIVMKYGKTSFP